LLLILEDFCRGAGIAGLTLAVALNAFDKDRKIVIDLYESASELSEIGAGINMWYRTWQVLKEIGAGDTLIPFFDHYPDLVPRTCHVHLFSETQNSKKMIF
jgi:salicylate hydroxylase